MDRWMQNLTHEEKIEMRNRRKKLLKRLLLLTAIYTVAFSAIWLYLVPPVVVILLLGAVLAFLFLCITECMSDITKLTQALNKNYTISFGVEL